MSDLDPNANGERGALIIADSADQGEDPCEFECVQRAQGGGISSRALYHPDRNNLALRFGAPIESGKIQWSEAATRFPARRATRLRATS